MLYCSKNFISIVFAFFVFCLTAASNASGREMLDLSHNSDEAIMTQNTVISIDQYEQSATKVQSNNLWGIDLNIGIAYNKEYGIPTHIGGSYNFTDFYRLEANLRFGFLGHFLLSGSLMNMFEFFGNNYVAFSVGAGFGDCEISCRLM